MSDSKVSKNRSAIKKSVHLSPKDQGDLDWLRERLDATTDSEVLRRIISFARHALETTSNNCIELPRENDVNLKILI